MTGTEIYKRTATYESEARSIRIHAPHWKVLLAYDGQRTLSEVAVSAETAFAETVTLTQKFLDSNWIAEEPITLDQYIKRMGASDITKTGAVVAPAVVLHDPEKDKPKPVAPPAPVLPPAPVAVQPPVTPPAPVPVTPPMPVMPPPLPPTTKTTPVPVAVLPPTTKTTPVPVAVLPPVAPTKRTMKLSAVVDYIVSLVGNASLGQILVYRVFLRVPPELLLAEDIASVHLSGDTSVINGEKLQKAIADAVHAVAKKALPESVFAAA